MLKGIARERCAGRISVFLIHLHHQRRGGTPPQANGEKLKTERLKAGERREKLKTERLKVAGAGKRVCGCVGVGGGREKLKTEMLKAEIRLDPAKGEGEGFQY